MRLLWPWALISLLPIAAAAFWALRRPLHRLMPVGSLRLWQQALEALGPAASKSRRLSPAWLVLLGGAVAAAVALSRPTYHAQSPARRIAVGVYPAAELAGLPGGLGEVLAAFLQRLDPRDRVQLILPAVLGGPGKLVSRDEAARRARALPCLPAPAEELSLPDAGDDVQHLYRFAPATLRLDDGPRTTTIALPARPGDVTIDAFAVAPLPAAGQVEVFAALRSHSMIRRRGELHCRRGADPPVRLGFDLAPGERRTLLVRLPAGGKWYSARIAGSRGAGGGAFAVRRRSPVRQVALLGRDDPLLRRFVQVNPALALVGEPARADAVIAVGAPAPAGKPALLIDPPAPPPGWRAGAPLAAVALRDADVLSDHPLLVHVDLAAVAVRRAAAWQPVGLPRQQRLVGIAGDALLLADKSPPRVYLAFDLAAENTNFAMTEAFVIFMANAVKYLVPGAQAREVYEYLTPLQAGSRADWKLLPAPAAPAAAGPLTGPGVYRDRAGALHAVSLLGLKSAEAKIDPRERIARISLPPPLRAAAGVELWPVLALAALALWLAGWALRLR